MNEPKTLQQALASLMRLCARAERSSGDALRLMTRWGLEADDRRQVLERLVRERFVDDARYAAAYVREKMRLSGWGAYKIRAALRAKGIAAETIDAALTEAVPADEGERIVEVMRRRLPRLHAADDRELKTKLIRYAISQGYPFEEVLEAADRVLREAR